VLSGPNATELAWSNDGAVPQVKLRALAKQLSNVRKPFWLLRAKPARTSMLLEVA
jgi:hypothetical protein